jgi:F0F1-type ATP synthase membrane subunit b/b'
VWLGLVLAMQPLLKPYNEAKDRVEQAKEALKRDRDEHDQEITEYQRQLDRLKKR